MQRATTVVWAKADGTIFPGPSGLARALARLTVAKTMARAHAWACPYATVVITPPIIAYTLTTLHTTRSSNLSLTFTMARTVIGACDITTVCAIEGWFTCATPIKFTLTVPRAVSGARRHVFRAFRERARVVASLAVLTVNPSNALVANARSIIAVTGVIAVLWAHGNGTIGPLPSILAIAHKID